MSGMIVFLIIILIVLAGGLTAVIFLLLKNKPEQDKQPLLMLQQQLGEINKTLDNKIGQSTQAMQQQFQQSAKIIRNVTEKLTQLDETNKQVVGFAGQLQSLENILKSPKQRGILGEYILEELLENVFSPNQYQMQYSFKDGQIVDAVIFVRDNKIIPIDSKFSLENYNRIVDEKDAARQEQLEKIFKQDLKNRIDETAKYIRPEEGTLNFAFMFIPAEAIYYDLLVNKVGAVQANTRALLEYAVREKNVHIVSPTSFYAYLQTILQGLKAFHIEKSAVAIRKGVEQLGKHIAVYDKYMQKLGGHISTTVNSYNTAYKELGKIDKDVVRLTQGKRKIEPTQIEKPNLE